jgi:hypothetical protein
MKKFIIPIILILVIILTIFTYFFLKDDEIEEYATIYQSNSREVVKDNEAQVEAELPEGWTIETYNKHVLNRTVFSDGITDIVVLNKGKIIFYLEPISDTGGIGGRYYVFPDSDPQETARNREIGSEYVEIVEVAEGEYSDYTFFDLHVRRIGHNLVPNVSEDSNYFSPSLEPILFMFENGPYVVLNLLEEDNPLTISDSRWSLYKVYISEKATKKQLKELDQILSSMRIK